QRRTGPWRQRRARDEGSSWRDGTGSVPVGPPLRSGAMLDPTSVLTVVATATFVAPLVFLAALTVAGRRRSIGAPVGPRLTALVTVLGGISLGLLLVMSGNLLFAW